MQNRIAEAIVTKIFDDFSGQIKLTTVVILDNYPTHNIEPPMRYDIYGENKDIAQAGIADSVRTCLLS